MEFIEPSVKLIKQEPGIDGVWKQIAMAARVCYQSEARKGESDLDFVKRVILKPALIEGDLNDLEHCKFDFNKMHSSCLEHGTVYLKIAEDLDTYNDFFEDNKYSVVTYSNEYPVFFVTTNMRVIIENDLFDLLIDWMVEPTPHHDKRYTFDVITDIGVSREGNRHRVNSTVEESTRYNAYDKGKYGSELTYIIPAWESLSKLQSANNILTLKSMCSDISEGKDIDTWGAEQYYLFALKAAEFAYMGIRHNNNSETWTAEKARQVLNLNTKTNVMWTAFLDDWKHFLALRSSDAVSGKPHPNMIVVADKIKELLDKETGGTE